MSSDLLTETGQVPRIKFNEQGLVPAIVQDAESGQVLMMAWMNDAALKQTLETRKATFYSRSRNKMWVKGESSGHVQHVIQALVDCDQDTLLLRVKSDGPACHVGYRSCFYRAYDGPSSLGFVLEKSFDPSTVYKAN